MTDRPLPRPLDLPSSAFRACAPDRLGFLSGSRNLAARSRSCGIACATIHICRMLCETIGRPQLWHATFKRSFFGPDIVLNETGKHNLQRGLTSCESVNGIHGNERACGSVQRKAEVMIGLPVKTVLRAHNQEQTFNQASGVRPDRALPFSP